MKTKNLLLFVFVCCASVSFAQIKVESNGNVGVGLNSTTTPLSRFAVGGAGATNASATIVGGAKTYSLKVESTGPVMNTTGVYATATSSGSSYYKATALHGIGGANTVQPTGMGIGVKGVALKSGYGVIGLIDGSGAGIYGGTGSDEVAISGLWAGYFNGSIKSTGSINGAVFVNSSDIRYKKDILTLKTDQSLRNVLMMKPIEYRLEQQYVEYTEMVDEIEVTKRQPVYDEKSQVFEKKHYGLIAQELQKLYPDLVYEDEDGYLAVNYVGIIPMLIQSIQALNDKIEVLEKAESALQSRAAEAEFMSENEKINNAIDETVNNAALYQNTPNPFNQSTEIGYYIPKTVHSANIYIYDISGVQQRNISISEREKGTVVLQASALRAGIYFYTLICDGKPIDSKQMILTR